MAERRCRKTGETGRLDHLGAYGGDGLEYSISGSLIYYVVVEVAVQAINNSAGGLDMMTSTEGAGGTGGGGGSRIRHWNGVSAKIKVLHSGYSYPVS